MPDLRVNIILPILHVSILQLYTVMLNDNNKLPSKCSKKC